MEEESVRRDILYILILLILTDISIVADIPFLRQSLPFLFFSITPGYILVRGFDIKPIEKFVLSVGLSLALLMFTGLIVNSLYPLVSRPLSLVPILVSLNFLVVIPLFIYMRKTDKTKVSFEIEWTGVFSHPIIFYPLFLPVLTVLGSYMMDTYSNNIILLFMLFSILVYIIVLALEKRRVHPIVYPLTLWCVGFSLLALNTLPSNYLIGRDIHMEYHCFKRALINQHWNIHDPYNSYNACLSLTILPAIYKYLLDVSSILVFKFYYCILGAIVPVPMYVLSHRILKSRSFGFYATLLLMFQFSYIYMGQYVRQLVAFIFFGAAIMVLTLSIRESYKKAIFIVFIVATVLSHYTSSYVFFAVVAFPPFIIWASKHLKRKFSLPWKYSRTFSNKNLALLFFIIIFLWYAQLTGSPFNDTLHVIIETFKSMANFFSLELRNYSEQAVLGIGLVHFPNFLSAFVHDVVFAIIGVGVLVLFFKKEYQEKYRINDEYIASTLVILAMLASFVILPYVSKVYGGARLFSQLLVILAPCFIIGTRFIVDYIKKLKVPFNQKKMMKIIILTLLILGFLCTNYLQYELFGIPYSYAYTNDSDKRYETFIYDSEITGSTWLDSYGNKTSKIHTDRVGDNRIILAFNKKPKVDHFFFNSTGLFREGDYIYLRYLNINQGLVFKDAPLMPPRFVNGKLKMHNVEPLTKYLWLITDKNVIYDNGGSRILFA